MEQAIRISPKETKSDIFHRFDLSDFLPTHEILVNISTSIVTLLSKKDEQNVIIAQRVLTDTEMRVLLPLLVYPTCCPQEVLQASYHCTYEVLLRSMFSADTSARALWNQQVREQRERLDSAHQQKKQRVEMKGVYNALFGLRQKLEQMGLTVRARKDGYYLSYFRG